MSLPDEILLMVIRIVSGEDGVKIAKSLEQKPEATDEEIASATEIQINTVRKILYQLYNSSLVTYRKTRNMETGWFIYHWKLQPARVRSFIRSQKIRLLRKLKVRLGYEKAHDFYFCLSPGCPEVTFEDAIANNFSCPSCGKLLKQYDNTELIKALESKIREIEGELKIQ